MKCDVVLSPVSAVELRFVLPVGTVVYVFYKILILSGHIGRLEVCPIDSSETSGTALQDLLNIALCIGNEFIPPPPLGFQSGFKFFAELLECDSLVKGFLDHCADVFEDVHAEDPFIPVAAGTASFPVAILSPAAAISPIP